MSSDANWLLLSIVESHSSFIGLLEVGMLPKNWSSFYERITDSRGIFFERSLLMKKKFSGPQIVAKLRQADILIGQGKKIPEVCREIDVSENTYYRWRQKYGGMSPDMIKQHRALQKENTRLRSVVADQALDIAILKEATKLGN
jgi:hypothetical protein